MIPNQGLGVVHKLLLQEEVGRTGGPKMSPDCQRSYHIEYVRGAGGQEKPKSRQCSL